MLALALRDPLAEVVFWLPGERDLRDGRGRARRGAARRRPRALGDHARGRAHGRAAARSGAARAADVAARRPRGRRALGRDRAPARRGAAAAAGGAGLARAHRRGRLRGAPAPRARPPRRRPAAPRLARPADPPHAALAAARGARCSRPALDQIVGEVGSAIADLRQIAAGVRPARLDDGLAAALHDLARTAPIPVDVEAPIGRVAASVEAAAYFVVCEALTNAVKHASASRSRHCAPSARTARSA